MKSYLGLDNFLFMFNDYSSCDYSKVIGQKVNCSNILPLASEICQNTKNILIIKAICIESMAQDYIFSENVTNLTLRAYLFA